MLRFRVKGKHPDELGGTSLWNLLSNNLRGERFPSTAMHRRARFFGQAIRSLAY